MLRGERAAPAGDKLFLVRRRAGGRKLASLVIAASFAAQVEPRALAQSPAGGNLRVAGVEAPDEGIAGRALVVSMTLEASGAPAPGTVRGALFLTINGVLDDAIDLGRFGPVSIAGAAPTILDEIVSLPTDVTGHFTVAAVIDADDVFAETNELDNVAFASRATRIRAEAPDLVVTAVRAREASRRAGEPVRIDVTIRNDGDIEATANVHAYVSEDPIISTTDAQIGATVVTVPAGASVSASVDSVLPGDLSTGDHTIGAIVDPEEALGELSEVNNDGASARALNVYDDVLALDTGDLPDGSLSIAYHAELIASGGDGRFTFRVSGGNLPLGLVLDPATGVIQGTPMRSGAHTFTIEVTSRGLLDARAFTVRIHETGAILTIVSRSIVNGAIGLPYEQLLVAAGGEPAYVWTIADDAGTIPPGLDLRTDGVISGVPNTLGTYSFGVTVTDRLGAKDSVEYTITISPPVNVLILLRDPPPARVGERIDFALSATGGVPPYRWVALSTPPPGLSIAENGRVVGTPTQVGRFPVRVRATDSTRVANSDTALVQIVVEDDGALRISTAPLLPPVRVRTPYQTLLQAEGGEPPYRWSLVRGDDLPSGFFLVKGDEAGEPEDTALIRGTSVRPQVHAFSVRVEDALRRSHERTFLIAVERPDVSGSTECTCVRTEGPHRSAFGLGLLALGAALASAFRRAPPILGPAFTAAPRRTGKTTRIPRTGGRSRRTEASS